MSSLKQRYLNYCIEGWIEDQRDAEELDVRIPSWTRHNIDDLSEAPTRLASPSKRQRTSNTGSSSKWAGRVSGLESDTTSLSFKNPLSATSTPRATSPTKSIRNRRVQLDYTKPAIFFGPPRQAPDSDNRTSDTRESSSQITDISIPPEIYNLIKRFSEEAVDLILPTDIISRINKISPTEFLIKPKTSDAPPSTNNCRKLLKHISLLFNMARESYAGSYDEAAWYPLIRLVLIGPPGTSSQPFIKHEEAQTMQSQLAINSILDTGGSAHLYKPVFRSQPLSFSLSAFNDPIASKTFTCAIVEAKAPGGNFQEASYQIAISSAAILERVKLLDGETGQAGNIQDHMPVIGWVVHGHFWTLHVSYREIDGSIRVLGPYPSGNTATSLGLYRLIGIVQEVKTWG